MMAGRYAHAKQFNRHRRQSRILRTRLGRLIPDIGRKIAGHANVEAAFAVPLARASQIRSQQQRQRGWKLYSFHAPETGVHWQGQTQRALRVWGEGIHCHHQRPRPGAANSCSPGRYPTTHTTVTPCGMSSRRPKGSPAARSSGPMSTRDTAVHDTENPRRVFISGQKRGVFGPIKRELRRRSAKSVGGRTLLGNEP
jgi:IS5 family transposase